MCKTLSLEFMVCERVEMQRTFLKLPKYNRLNVERDKRLNLMLSFNCEAYKLEQCYVLRQIIGKILLQK